MKTEQYIGITKKKKVAYTYFDFSYNGLKEPTIKSSSNRFGWKNK